MVETEADLCQKPSSIRKGHHIPALEGTISQDFRTLVFRQIHSPGHRFSPLNIFVNGGEFAETFATSQRCD